MKGISQKDWAYEYSKLGTATWGEADYLLKELSDKQLKEFIEDHRAVQDWTGLDMRQEWMVTAAAVMLVNRAAKLKQDAKVQCDTCILDICTDYGKEVQKEKETVCPDWKGKEEQTE